VAEKAAAVLSKYVVVGSMKATPSTMGMTIPKRMVAWTWKLARML